MPERVRRKGPFLHGACDCAAADDDGGRAAIPTRGEAGLTGSSGDAAGDVTPEPDSGARGSRRAMLPPVGILEPGPRLFSLVTRRSLLPPPDSRSDSGWEESWAWLGEVYAPALRRYVFHVLRSWHQRTPDPEEPEAIVQGFLLKCMESGQLAERSRKVRKFRAWVAVHLKRYTKDYLDKKFAKKRNPEGGFGSDEALHGVADDELDPTLVAQLDKGWVQVAMERALGHLRAGVGARKWGPTYAEIIQDLMLTSGEGSADLAERLGLEQRKLPNLKNRAKEKFAELFVDELRTTVRDEEALGELLRELAPYMP